MCCRSKEQSNTNMMKKVSSTQQFHRKVGIMGGTFNPIHYGHLLMAERAFEDFALDEVCFIPTGLQWMKKGSPDLIAGDVRYEMTAMAIEGRGGFGISRMEIDRQGNTYTYETMQDLKKQQPDTEFYYILGADTLAKMDQWMHPEIVFDSAVILCAVREGEFLLPDQSSVALHEKASDNEDAGGLQQIILHLKEKYQADIRLLSMPRMDISSTAIRNRIKEGKSVRYLLPDAVIDYIRQNQLYL